MEFEYGIYQGQILNEARHGIARFIGQGFSGQSIHEGEHFNNRLHGYGRKITESYHYVGEWKCHLRHGYGKCVHKDGRVEEGQWESDKFIG